MAHDRGVCDEHPIERVNESHGGFALCRCICFQRVPFPWRCPLLQMMQFLYPLLKTIDPELAAHLQASDLPPYFALSWIITWFSHDVKDLQVRTCACCKAR